jgi:hypothetical protein
MVPQTVGTLLLLPARTIYRGTYKQYSGVRVQMNCTDSIAEKRGSAKELVLLFIAMTHRATKRNGPFSLFIPDLKMWGFLARFCNHATVYCSFNLVRL